MGDAGGVLASEIGDEAFLTRFIPALTRYLMLHADRTGIFDDVVLEKIGVDPAFWLIGRA